MPMPREPYDKPEREHGPLDVRVFKSKTGLLIAEQPSGACYHVRPDGWRRVPDEVVAKARAQGEAA